MAYSALTELAGFISIIFKFILEIYFSTVFAQMAESDRIVIEAENVCGVISVLNDEQILIPGESFAAELKDGSDGTSGQIAEDGSKSPQVQVNSDTLSMDVLPELSEIDKALLMMYVDAGHVEASTFDDPIGTVDVTTVVTDNHEPPTETTKQTEATNEIHGDVISAEDPTLQNHQTDTRMVTRAMRRIQMEKSNKEKCKNRKRFRSPIKYKNRNKTKSSIKTKNLTNPDEEILLDMNCDEDSNEDSNIGTACSTQRGDPFRRVRFVDKDIKEDGPSSCSCRGDSVQRKPSSSRWSDCKQSGR